MQARTEDPHDTRTCGGLYFHCHRCMEIAGKDINPNPFPVPRSKVANKVKAKVQGVLDDGIISAVNLDAIRWKEVEVPFTCAFGVVMVNEMVIFPKWREAASWWEVYSTSLVNATNLVVQAACSNGGDMSMYDLGVKDPRGLEATSIAVLKGKTDRLRGVNPIRTSRGCTHLRPAPPILTAFENDIRLRGGTPAGIAPCGHCGPWPILARAPITPVCIRGTSLTSCAGSLKRKEVTRFAFRPRFADFMAKAMEFQGGPLSVINYLMPVLGGEHTQEIIFMAILLPIAMRLFIEAGHIPCLCSAPTAKSLLAMHPLAAAGMTLLTSCTGVAAIPPPLASPGTIFDTLMSNKGTTKPQLLASLAFLSTLKAFYPEPATKAFAKMVALLPTLGDPKSTKQVIAMEMTSKGYPVHHITYIYRTFTTWHLDSTSITPATCTYMVPGWREGKAGETTALSILTICKAVNASTDVSCTATFKANINNICSVVATLQDLIPDFLRCLRRVILDILKTQSDFNTSVYEEAKGMNPADSMAICLTISKSAMAMAAALGTFNATNVLPFDAVLDTLGLLAGDTEILDFLAGWARPNFILAATQTYVAFFNPDVIIVHKETSLTGLALQARELALMAVLAMKNTMVEIKFEEGCRVRGGLLLPEREKRAPHPSVVPQIKCFTKCLLGYKGETGSLNTVYKGKKHYRSQMEKERAKSGTFLEAFFGPTWHASLEAWVNEED